MVVTLTAAELASGGRTIWLRHVSRGRGSYFGPMSIELELRRFEAELEAVVARARECVAWLRTSQSEDLQFLVAIRLPMLGSVILPELMSIIEDEHIRGSTRYLAAKAAVDVGDRDAGVEVLCEEVDADTKWSLPAAVALAYHGLRAGLGPVVRALRRVDPSDDVEVMGYSTALRDLGGSLPDELRRQLLDSASPWVARALKEDFPE